MSSLEASITLEDIFAVVEAKRVPLAPELAGYLSLEIADGMDAGGGDVDPKTVFISEEGTVALVRPKKDVTRGDAEASVRRLLTKLLDASGSGTPALTTAARRKPGNGLPALVEELEAALIPVNRAAGRRALARLAREAKRVLLGVGRNASVPAPHARPVLRRREEEGPLSGARPEPPPEPRPEPPIEPPADGAAAEVDPVDAAVDAMSAPPPGVGPAAAPGTPLPAPPSATKPSVPPPPLPRRDVTPSPAAAATSPPPSKVEAPPVFGRDDVDSLLDSFGVSSPQEEKHLSRELKAIAGLSPTPPPPDPTTLAELTKDVGKDLPRGLQSSRDGDSVEALLALAEASAPAPSATTEPPTAKDPAPAAPPVSGPLAGGLVASPGAPGAPAALRPPPESGSKLDAPRAVPVAPESRPGASSQRSRFDAPPPDPRVTTARRARAENGPRAPKTGMAMLVLALLVLGGGTIAIWRFAPQVFTGKKRPAPTAAAPSASAPTAPKCKVALVLTDVPANAEILLRMGQAPIDVERMPVGTRLELVATAEGHAPRRAVIKADAQWEKGPDGKPRYEVPIQLDPSRAKAGTLDPWPAAEPGSQVGGSGAPGTVHVVSNVRGAEVWLLAGLGPEARIEQLRCDADVDVLLAGLPAVRKRVHVAEKDIAAAPADPQGNKVVNVSAGPVGPGARDH